MNCGLKIVFLGKPGAGKGTYAARVSKIYKIPVISTGELLREEVKKGTALGKSAKKYMEAGQLVPNTLVNEVFKRRLEKPDCKRGFILDGYPRTTEQAKLLDKLIGVDKVIYFDVKDRIILERLCGRRTCSKCGAIFHIKNIPPKKQGICDYCGGKIYVRPDQTEDAIKTRIEVYNKITKPVLDYYKEKGILRVVNADKDFSTHGKEIIKSIIKAIEG